MKSLNISDPSLVGGDTLTCGECKRDFKLQELTLFIQHKALNSCKKLKSTKNLETDYEEVVIILLLIISISPNFVLQVKSSSPKDGHYVSLGSPSISGSGKNDYIN